MGLDLKSTVNISVVDLEKSMEKSVGQKFEAASLDQAEQSKMLSITGEGPQRKVVFVPSELSRTMAHLMAYRKLEQLQSHSEQESIRHSGAA
jgi:hypothetical protein